MDLLKALKRTTYISAAGLLALGATEACAADATSVMGHISASVAGTLSVKEISAVNFGNFAAAACGTTAPVAGTAGADSIVMDPKGVRTKTGCFTLLYGADAGQNGDNGTTGGHFETGGQSPGFYSITGSLAGGTNVYVSFADTNGDVVDSQYGSQGTGSTVYTHPNNYVTLTGPTANAFAVNEFTFETDNTAAANGSSGYTQLQPATWDSTSNSGNYVTLAGATATLRVGAKLTPLTAAPAAGKYTGTFHVMVSY